MTYSEKLVNAIKAEEGFTAVAHHLDGDRPNVVTGGYGETDVVLGQTFTEAQADARLRSRLNAFAAEVSRLVRVPLTQGQFDALTDFVYNEGPGNLAKSTLLVRLNCGDYQGADAEFARWNLAGGKVLAGLSHRRAIEAAWFETPASEAA